MSSGKKISQNYYTEAVEKYIKSVEQSEDIARNIIRCKAEEIYNNALSNCGVIFDREQYCQKTEKVSKDNEGLIYLQNNHSKKSFRFKNKPICENCALSSELVDVVQSQKNERKLKDANIVVVKQKKSLEVQQQQIHDLQKQIKKTGDSKIRAEKAESKLKKYLQQNRDIWSLIKHDKQQVIKNNKCKSSINCLITGMKFNYIPSGTFLMGGSSNDKVSLWGDEQPQHPVTLTNSFFMQTTVVTKKQWYEVMRNRPWYREKNVSLSLNSPAVYISWNDCQKYITKINSISDNVYRLPTEAEWEYSARAGSITAYCFGNSLDELSKYSQYSMASSSSSYSSAGVVAHKEPNNWGLYDIHGNVMEWCQDWHGAYLSKPIIDPKGHSSGSNRVARGGSWRSGAWGCRSAFRSYYGPAAQKAFIGFRLVCIPS